MKTDLSSQITLTRIPQRYYRPENAFEHSVLTRLEKIPTNIYESADEGSFAIAKEIADQIRKKQEIGENFVMAIPGGRSPLSVYKELIRMHKEEQLSFRNVVVFVEYEFFPLVSPSAGNVAQLKEALLDHIDIAPENVYAPDGCMPKDAIIDFCRMYEENIQKAGGLDYILLGVGHASNIMFNGVGATLSSRTRLVLLEGTARKEASRTFPSLDNVPAGVITMGIATMMKARNVILMAWGEDKAKIIAKTVEGKVSDAVPSSYLQNHTNAKVVVDLSAAYDLTRISHPWLVTNCEWDNKLIRRAIDTYNADLIQTAVKNATVEIPEVMIKDRVEQMIQELAMNMEGRGLKLDDYLKFSNKTIEDLRSEYKDSAAENVRADLVLDAIATAEGIEVTPDDMNREIFIMAQNFGADPKEVWDIIAKEGRVAMLAGSVARKKAARFIIDNAKGAEAAE
mgnify:CR=1 FL=1